ncbi:hypothetical protein BCR37DRAFT_380484 [Protomyces lactucae-debilis]|uniref:Uncharacterized protein n=1 Tax=Protomyces lactucae-debilis TaxID=2754530 RepID=A0A1Y2FE51_PROLT|nr:uncharacterized protein BCR37DRAFT_380484 [Protomyces lactucae-debilis]ORY81586.1 hypothetical protein BCR37DRAFT_380484 [Protomyces lactucae-debilis]
MRKRIRYNQLRYKQDANKTALRQQQLQEQLLAQQERWASFESDMRQLAHPEWEEQEQQQEQAQRWTLYYFLGTIRSPATMPEWLAVCLLKLVFVLLGLALFVGWLSGR